MASTPLESDIQRQLLAAIGAIPGLLCERMNTGTAQDSRTGRVVRFGTPGGPDIRVTLQSLAIGIECKSATGRQSPEQLRWMRAFEAAGGRYMLCRDAAATVWALSALATGETRAALVAAADLTR